MNDDPKELLLREDRRLLGRLLGEVIREQVGAGMLERIETIRQTAVRFRRDAEGRAELEAQLNALEGEQIPLAARILRVADSYAALTDDRPRRHSMEDGEAKQYMTEWAGLEFDPKVVKAFLSIDAETYMAKGVTEHVEEKKYRFS